LIIYVQDKGLIVYVQDKGLIVDVQDKGLIVDVQDFKTHIYNTIQYLSIYIIV